MIMVFHLPPGKVLMEKITGCPIIEKYFTLHKFFWDFNDATNQQRNRK